MIYLKLFLTFLKVGAVSFGGGYGMIALIRESVLSAGWMTEAELLNFIAVAESTPGPIAVNMATFVGSYQGGVLGAFLATLGVVFPSFLIILTIAALARGLLKRAGVRAVLGGVKPAIVGMVLATGVTMLLSVLFGLQTVQSTVVFGWREPLILAILIAGAITYGKWRKRPASPIVMILLSAVCGVLLF
jgi:chromate transporter